jgi:hypothetical protein
MDLSILADVSPSSNVFNEPLFGWLQITWPNFLVILTMVLLFVLALVVPFPKDKDQ